MGQEIIEGGGWVRAETAEDVGEVGDGLDAVGFAGGGQGVEAGNVSAGLLVTHKEKVLPAKGHDSKRRLAPVVVWRDARIVEKAGELGPVVEGVPDGARHRALRRVLVTGAALLAAARRSDWTNSGPFARMIEALSDPDAEIRSTLGVIAEFAVMLRRQPILDMRRESLFRATLDGIGQNWKADDVARHLGWLLTQRFKLNPLAGNSVLRILAVWRTLRLR